MGKIVIVGTTHSGKSCYFYGMMRKMMVGTSGFSIGVDKSDYGEIRQFIKRLADVSQPLDQRFPAPSDAMRTYPLKLLYQMSVMEEFDWVDYPGELVSNSADEFIGLMKDANCLLICVDGEGIQGDPDNLDEIAVTLNADWDCMDLNNALAQAVLQNEDLPPVCLMIAKYDKLSPEFRNQELLLELMKKVFPTLFFDGQGSGSNRMVMIVPVTLGKDLDKGAKLAPKNTEIPICFAAYLIQLAKMLAFQEQCTGLIDQNKTEVNQWNQRGFLGRLFHKKPEPLTEEQIEAMQKLLNNKAGDVDALRQVLEDVPLYLNGKAAEWN